MDTFSNALAGLLADWAVRTALWLGLWALGLRVLRIPPGAPRHAAWAIALGALALLPFARVPDPRPVRTDPIWHVAEAAWGSLEEPAKLPQAPVEAVRQPAPNRQIREHPLTLADLLDALWLLGFSFMAVQFLRGYIDLKRLIRTATPISDPAWQTLLQTYAAKLGAPRTVALKSSVDIDGPVSTGWRHPTILLPETLCSAAPTEDAHRILLHELAHICRRDFLVTFFQRLCEIGFFYHPFVWYASHHLTLHRELACDDWVLSHSPDRRAYALSLIAHAGQSNRTPRMGAALFGSPGRLVVRIQQIMNTRRPVVPNLSRRILAVFLLGACAGLAVIGCIAFVRTGRLNPNVQSLMQQAHHAAVTSDRRTADQLAEQATGYALAERDETDRKRNLMFILENRAAWSLNIPAHRQYYASALDLAESLDDRAAQAHLHLLLGLNVPDSIGAPHLQAARRLYAALGDAEGEGRACLWQATGRMNAGQLVSAEAEFRRAEHLLDGRKSVTAILADAACDLLARPDRDRLADPHTGYGFGNTILRTKNDALNYQGEGGGSRSVSVNRHRSLSNRSVFHEAGLLGAFFPSQPAVGTRWGGNVHSFGQFPLQGFGLVLDDNAAVTVPAGAFTGCLHIRIQVLPTPETQSESHRIDALNKLLCGVRDIYYAPGVGIVKIAMELQNGTAGDLVLTHYQVTGPTGAFLPLDIGNTWTYSWQTPQNDDFNEQILQVRRQIADVIYLSRYHIDYAKEGAL